MKTVFSLILLSFATASSAAPLVILDAGHGGADAGAIQKSNGKTYNEKDLTLALTLKTAAALERHGIKSLLTRTKDEIVALDDRAKFANQNTRLTKQAVFVSIHLNSNPESHIRGMETYVFNATTNEAAKHLAEIENQSHRIQQKGTLNLILDDLSATGNYADSVGLACSVHKSFYSKPTAIQDRGVKQSLFYVLMGIRVPAILIEAGFITNEKDLNLLSNPIAQENIAEKLATGLEAYFTKYKVQKLAKKFNYKLKMSAIQKKTGNAATLNCPN